MEASATKHASSAKAQATGEACGEGVGQHPEISDMKPGWGFAAGR